MLVRCLYASRAAAPLTPAVMDSILEQSRRNNQKSGITGMLCMSDDVFIQVLEGGRDAVCELYSNIVKDTRHTQVRLLQRAMRLDPSLPIEVFSNNPKLKHLPDFHV